MTHIPLAGTDATDSASFPVGFDEAHRKGIPHRGVHIQIEDASGRFLICRRADGRLEIPGGHVDWRDDRAETYAEAALRELAEELALVENWRVPPALVVARLGAALVPLGKFINQLPSSHGYNNEWVTVFRLSWRGSWGGIETFRLGDGAISPKWAALEEIVGMCLGQPLGVNSALRAFLARAGGVLVPLVPPRDSTPRE